MALRRIVVLGGHGDGCVVAHTLRDAASDTFAFLGFLNDAVPAGGEISGMPVLGSLEDWQSCPDDVVFIAALHKLKQMAARKRRIVSLGIPDQRYATVIHPTAAVASDVRIGAGSFLAAHVVVQSGASLGRHASLRAGANIGHDAVVDDFAYIGPNATLCGRAHLMEGVHLGPNAVVVDGQTVEPFAVVGAGTVVTKRVPSFEIHFGVPARRVASIPVPA